jgi:hypothetical protein
VKDQAKAAVQRMRGAETLAHTRDHSIRRSLHKSLAREKVDLLKFPRAVGIWASFNFAPELWERVV